MLSAMKPFLTLTLLLSVCVPALGAVPQSDNSETEITALLQRLVDAQLRSDASVAEFVYDDALLLTSQSGTLYGKKDALVDIKNVFESYRNDDLKFVHLAKDIVILNHQSTRQRKGFDEGKFRVTSVWVRKANGWKIVALQSTRIAPPR
jgi:ketosteroid isomerase-like protein